MSPPREGRATDATKLILPLPVAIGMVIFAISMVGGVWGAYYAQQNNYAELRTQMEWSQKLQEERLTNLRDDVAESKRQMQLLQYENQQLREAVNKLLQTQMR